MRVTIVGSGYVGLVTGACLAELGHDVTNVDQDSAKIAALQNPGLGVRFPIYEPGLEDLVKKGQQSGKLKFSSNLADGIREAEVIMLAVGTPERPGDGHADLTYVFDAVKQIALLLKPIPSPQGGEGLGVRFVMKSTVPVGTARQVSELVAGKKCQVVSNPEFLREGSAIEDFMHPDRIVIGSNNEQARAVMSELYRPLLKQTPVLFTNCETAELIKYASNAFLATKIAYINQMADVCEKTGADIQELAKGMGLDPRIGTQFLNPGPGYGGSCFPKDTVALSKMAQDVGSPVTILDAVIEANKARVKQMAQRVLSIFEKRGGASGKTLAVLGITFKPHTDDMREAPSQVILPALQKAGLSLVVYDPAYALRASAGTADVYSTIENADGVLILTEWDEFKHLDLPQMAKTLRTPKGFKPLLIDLRNIYDPSQTKDFEYHSIGRGA